MRSTFLASRLLAIAAAASLMAGVAQAAPYMLDNGPGNGSVSVGVDGYGAFGSSNGGNTTDATFDPLGDTPAAAGTVYQSMLALRVGTTGQRTWLSDAAVGSNPSVLNGVSSFVVGTLRFDLTQSLTELSANGARTGSLLTQTYVVTNLASTATNFELVRYLDGDLQFDNSIDDGGGRILSNGTEILFETDSATGSSDSTTFVGISAEGGVAPATGRYEIAAYSGLRGRIESGTALADSIQGDSGDADEFIDAGAGYDVTLALRNLFALDANGSATYVARTYFGNGAPDEVPPPVTGVPEPGSLALVGLALLGLGAMRRRRG